MSACISLVSGDYAEDEDAQPNAAADTERRHNKCAHNPGEVSLHALRLRLQVRFGLGSLGRWRRRRHRYLMVDPLSLKKSACC